MTTPDLRQRWVVLHVATSEVLHGPCSESEAKAVQAALEASRPGIAQVIEADE